MTGKPVYDYTNCMNCMACAHACPKIAIKLTCIKETNPNARYRNAHIRLEETMQANCVTSEKRIADGCLV